jgi:hypothetical protein
VKHHLFKRRDGVIGVPMRIGPVDPNVYELRVNPDVIASRGLISAQIGSFVMLKNSVYGNV